MREIVLDTETTGLDPLQGHRLVEVGCIELLNRIPTGATFHSYLNPEREVPAEAFAIHGLATEFLKDKPLFADIADDFLSFIGDALEFGDEEAVVEAGIVDHQRRVADEAEEIVGDVGEKRLVLEEFGRQPVDGEGLSRYFALRIEIAVERRAGRNPVEQLDAADLDQAVTLQGIQPGGFGVEDDFTHF